MKKLFYGLFVAVAMMVSQVSFADTGMYTGVDVEPVYVESALLTTDPPMAPANKPNNDGIGTGSIGRTMSLSYYAVHTALIPKSVLAHKVTRLTADVPSKVPI